MPQLNLLISALVKAGGALREPLDDGAFVVLAFCVRVVREIRDYYCYSTSLRNFLLVQCQISFCLIHKMWSRLLSMINHNAENETRNFEFSRIISK